MNVNKPAFTYKRNIIESLRYTFWKLRVLQNLEVHVGVSRLPFLHSLARLFPLEKRSLSETVVSMARCVPTHHFTVLMRQQE